MIYVSRDVMKDFTLYYPELKDNMVLYNTNDDTKIIRMASEPLRSIKLSNEINIVSVGRLVPMKGFDRLVEVHHRLKKNGIKNHVYILGTGVLENELKKLVKKNGDTDTVHFLGFYSNPYSVVSRCNVYVCSSHREGFSTAVTEALILGIPVVTTSVSGAYEQMGENNEFGIVTENSTDGLYNGLRQLLNSKEQLDYYTKKALIRGGFFSKKNSIKAVEKVIDSL
jgi:glycosyltransferase involved in cell wall biosynthesis